jgi:uncharacterized GH25 family protein
VRRRAVLLGLATACLAPAASAHDFWIEPSTFRPSVGSVVAVSLRVGEGFRGDPVLRDPAMIQKFVLVSGSQETPIAGRSGVDPAGIVRIAEPGVAWIAFRSGRKSLTLEAEKFDAYLGEEGLERIRELRKQRGESGKPAREVFSRSVKSMLVAGEAKGGAKDFDRPLGLTLEIVPRGDPRGVLAAGGGLPLTLLYEGKPLEGALVVAINQAAPEKKLEARTDARGEVTLALPGGGVWLVKAVHMTPAPPGLDAEWESLWTSLTFEIP